MSGLEALRAALSTHGGTLGHLAQQAPEPALGDAGPAQLAAQGPRTDGRSDEYELLLEMIFEGSLLHYADPRVVRPHDADLGLLLGDQLYALGLARLAELDDLESVSELADVISLISQAAMVDDEELARAAWEAGAAAIGWGAQRGHEQAKQRARSGSSEGPELLRAAAALRSPSRS